MKEKCLTEYITTIPDTPKPGVMFRDITTVLEDPTGFQLAVNSMCWSLNDIEFDTVVGLDARGFIFSSVIADRYCKGLVLARKKGKLFRPVVSQEYDLEYGHETIEIPVDSIKPDAKVVIVDDLLATGGTVGAVVELVRKLGGKIVQLNFLIELVDLKGRERLKGYDIMSVVKYHGE